MGEDALKMKRRCITVGVGLAALVLTACSGGAGPPGAGERERVIRIEALDSLAFDPESLRVEVGETVRFVVTNSGAAAHEFVLGPESVQAAHEEASDVGQAHGGMHVEGQLAALELRPGATEEVDVAFREPGELVYGCHEPGHYDGGMRGTVSVS